VAGRVLRVVAGDGRQLSVDRRVAAEPMVDCMRLTGALAFVINMFGELITMA
jgi:hypothetical protein